MDVAKQYILQCIVSAANNLRLSSEKIEVVALLREFIGESGNVEQTIASMKKITEFSKFAIKLGEVSGYIHNSKIDFLKISDRFREHSIYIVKELSTLLDVVTPQTCRELIDKITTKGKPIEVPIKDTSAKPDLEKPVQSENTDEVKKHIESESLKKDYILEDYESGEEVLNFEMYEKKVLAPIKEMDAFLNDIEAEGLQHDKNEYYCQLMELNADLSNQIGFDLLANMHNTIANALRLMHKEEIEPAPEVIEGMRACLIVIAAVVRRKDVDISGYLNKAESLSKRVNNNEERD